MLLSDLLVALVDLTGKDLHLHLPHKKEKHAASSLVTCLSDMFCAFRGQQNTQQLRRARTL